MAAANGGGSFQPGPQQPPEPAPGSDPRHRFRQYPDPAGRRRLTLTLLAAAVIWTALQGSGLDLRALADPVNLRTLGSFLSGFWPPAHTGDFPALLLQASLETLAIATAGMALALLLALPASLLASRALSLTHLLAGGERTRRGLLLRWPVRALLIVLRSIPEIVWALLLVRIVGLGPSAGVLAIAITYAGMLGKVFAEIYESVDLQPARAIVASGGSRLQAFSYGVLPNALAEMLSYGVYRWECAVRASMVMGFVGAGGLGQQMELSLRMFAGGEVLSILLVFLLLVLISDQLSHGLRRVFT
jgi:phosphonate transport system permease protein